MAGEEFQVTRIPVGEGSLHVRRAFQQLQSLVKKIIGGDITITSNPDSGPPGGVPRVKTTDVDISQGNTGIGGPWECIVVSSTTAENRDITMWSATDINGLHPGAGTISYYKNNSSTYTMQVYTYGSETINENDSSAIIAANGHLTLISDGSNWFQIAGSYTI